MAFAAHHLYNRTAHHGESMANWQPTHCLPKVPGKRTDAYSMASVHWLIEMNRKLLQPPFAFSEIAFK